MIVEMDSIQFNEDIYKVFPSLHKERSFNNIVQEKVLGNVANEEKFNKIPEIRSWLYSLFNKTESRQNNREFSGEPSLKKKIHKLNEPLKSTFIGYYSGKNLEQIALSQEVHINTIKNQLKIAQKLLF